MSETTTTPNYGLIKPDVNADDDLWGDHWNQNADNLDSLIHGIDTRAQVTSFNTRTGAVTLQASDVSALGFATTTANDASYVNVAGDNMTGPLGLSGNAVSAMQAVPLQQLNAAVPQPGAATPNMDSTGAAGVSTLYSRQDHTHPVDTSRYAASNPAGYQTAAQVTTALAPYAPLASPAFTGTPTTAATPAPGDSSTKLATTAFVANAMSSAATAVSIGDTPPASPQPGNLWFDSTNVSLLIRYRDPSGPDQWVVANNQNALPDAPSDGGLYGRQNAAWAAVAPAAALNNAGRNFVHNGLFNVAQRGAGPFTASGYTVDRWQLLLSGDSATVAQQNASDAFRAVVGDEAARYFLTNSFTGTAAATAYNELVHKIESVRRLAGKTVTLSFWASAGVAGVQLGLSGYNSYGSGGSPSGADGFTTPPVTLTVSMARYSRTFTVPSSAGRTLGTNGDDYTGLQFWFSTGANNASTSGIGVQSGTINLWGVQLEIGSTATPLEKPDPADDLRRCQRFYQTGSGAFYGAGVTGSAAGAQQPFPATMRVNPTINVNLTGSYNVSTTPSGISAYPSSMLVLWNGTANAAVGVTYTYTASADL